MTMTRAAFVRLARTVVRNAATYRTKQACEMMLARVKAALWESGSYGADLEIRAAAISAIQDRWVDLDCDERAARLAVLLAAD